MSTERYIIICLLLIILIGLLLMRPTLSDSAYYQQNWQVEIGRSQAWEWKFNRCVSYIPINSTWWDCSPLCEEKP